MHKEDVEVVIVLSIFNGKRFLLEQVQSIQRITTVNWLVLWRDDNSTDGSKELLYQLIRHDPRFIEIEGSGLHLGVLLSFQALVKASKDYKWKWLAFCDQDDIWQPNRFDNIDQYENSKVPTLIIGKIKTIDEKGFERPGKEKIPQIGSKYLSVIENAGPGCGMAINLPLSKIFSNLQFNVDSSFLHDHFCFVISRFFGLTIFDSEIWTSYRLHGRNTIGMNNGIRNVLKRILPSKGKYVGGISKIAQNIVKIPNLENRDKEFLLSTVMLKNSNLAQRYIYLRKWKLRRDSISRTIYTWFKILLNV